MTAVLLMVAATVGASEPIPAEPGLVATSSVETSSGGYLALTSDLDGVTVLTPGDTVAWEIGLRAALPERVPIDLLLGAAGSLVDDPDGLVVGVQSCPRPWGGDGCAAGAEVLMAPRALAGIPDGDAPLGAVDDSPRWMLVTVGLPVDATASSTGGGVATIELSASASGTGPPDESSDGAADRLPPTGVRVIGPLLLAAGSITTGVVLARIGRRRPQPEDRVATS